MKILVTGANGYLGQGITRQLLDDGVEVIAAGQKTDCVDSRAQRVDCDIFNIEDPFSFLNEPDVVLHLAWNDGFIHNSDIHINELPKHYAFLKKLIASGVKRVAVMGTMHEIGFYEGSVKEDTPTHPMSLYGISKDALRNLTELMCANAGITFQWLRGYYIVGNSAGGSSIFSKIVAAENSGSETFPFTNGQNQCDFIDYKDFCTQTAAAVEQDKVCGVINICSGRPEKLCDRVERFIDENGFKIKLDYGKYPDRPYDSKAIWGDAAKIQAVMKEYYRA